MTNWEKLATDNKANTKMSKTNVKDAMCSLVNLMVQKCQILKKYTIYK